jgi:hypothetical protein
MKFAAKVQKGRLFSTKTFFRFFLVWIEIIPNFAQIMNTKPIVE